jgi:hypothetical protein
MVIGRPCTTCHHVDRQEIESAIASGETFRGIARRYGLTPDAVERHAARHLPVDVARSDFRGRPGTTAADLMSRIVEVADSARAVRVAEGLSVRDVLRAGDAELRALATLTGRFGADAGRLAAELDAERAQRAEAERAFALLARALAAVLRDRPELTTVAAQFLDNAGAPDMAADVRELSLRKAIA